MKEFEVAIHEHRNAKVFVEARNWEEAEEKAKELYYSDTESDKIEWNEEWPEPEFEVVWEGD